MKLSDIPRFIRQADYCIDLSFDDLYCWIERQQLQRLDLDPDFQRGHVWTEAQQIAYIEFILAGGYTGKDLYFNHPGWRDTYKGDFVLVDGKQRLLAITKFTNNLIPAFGTYLKEFDEPEVLLRRYGVKVHVNNLQTRKECLKWYIQFNEGGTPHTKAEIDKVKDLIKLEK